MHQILKAHIRRKEFDHGYLLCGDDETGRKMAFEAATVILQIPQGNSLETPKEFPWGKLAAHPDFFYKKFELFGIDDSRMLKEWASSRPFFGSGKVAIMEIFSLSAESANALLKVFEEPNEGVHFFVISPSAEAVMPTLRSRLTVINNATEQNKIEEETIGFCKEFLSLAPNKRLESIKKALPDKAKAVEFLNGLEMILEKTIRTSARLETTKALEEIQKGRQFIFDRASSPKMIMEHLALALPRF